MNVADVGYILNNARIIGKNGAREYRSDRIFCSADENLAAQGLSALDNVFFQNCTSPLSP